MKKSLNIFVVVNLFLCAECLPSTTTSTHASASHPCAPVPFEVLWKKLEAVHPLLDRFSHPATRGQEVTRKSVQGQDSNEKITGQRFVRSTDDDEATQRSFQGQESNDEAIGHKVVPRSAEGHKVTQRSLQGRHGPVRNLSSMSTPDSRTKLSPSKKLRETQRNKESQEAASLKPSSWLCRLETEWTRMEDGVFPPYIETGKCTQKTCMMGLYACTPRRYAVKVLQRVRDQCNPLPRTGSQNATYEEVWAFTEYHVTVGCDCSKRRATGKFTVKPPTHTQKP